MCVGGDGRLRYFALCCYVYMYHILAAPPPMYGFLDTRDDYIAIAWIV